MNRSQIILAALLSGLAIAFTVAAAPAAKPAPANAAAPAAALPAVALPAVALPAAPPELTAKSFLYETVRHLYRWHIDERDIDPVVKANEVICWIRDLLPKLDDGDRSRFGEILLPQFSVIVRVKQADYTIPELNVVVKNLSFRITSVERSTTPLVKPEGAAEVRLVYTELRDELFRTRNTATFPEGELLERLRAAVRTELQREMKNAKAALPAETQVVYMAPLSPIANEAWVFWETGRTLIRFASDIDLTNPAIWEHEKLAVHLYALDSKVVVSLDEVGGSNAFMTRNEAGRAIFNCVVLGRRVELAPPAKPDVPPAR